MANFRDLDKEQIAAMERFFAGKANTTGKDGYVFNEPFSYSQKVPQTDILTETPTSDTDFAEPEYADYPVIGAVGTRHIQVRLHSYLPSGLTGPNSVQSFISVTSPPASNSPTDINSVRLFPLISPRYSPFRGNADQPNEPNRGFELALYPAKSNGGIGNPLVADTDKPISIAADPGAGFPSDVAAGAGDAGNWTVDYEAGIVRFSRPPLNGSNGVMNPNDVYSDINGLETTDAYGSITMFATFYHYTGGLGTTQNTQFVTVGDGYVSTGIFTGENHNIVQAALNSLPAQGGTVFLKEGTYDFQGSVVLPKYTSIIGLDGAIILRPPTVPAFIIRDGYNTIQGLEIQLRRDVPIQSGGAIELRVGSSGLMQDVEIKNNVLYSYAEKETPGIALAAEANGTLKDIRITNNIFDVPDAGLFNNSKVVYIGEINTGFTSTINSVEISNNIFDPKSITNGANAVVWTDISFGTGSFQGNLLITNNKLENNSMSFGGSGVDFSEFIFTNNVLFQVIISDNLDNSIISNNSMGRISISADVTSSVFNGNVLSSYLIVGGALTTSNIVNNTAPSGFISIGGTITNSNLVANIQPDGYGAQIQGFGSGAGLMATGGDTNADGVVGVASGDGYGIKGFGGDAGVYGVGNRGKPGVLGLGNDLGSGVLGVTSKDTNSRGVIGVATGANIGVEGIGIQASSVGVIGVGNGASPVAAITAAPGAGVIGIASAIAGVYGAGSAGNVNGMVGLGALAGSGGSFTGGTSGFGVVGTGGTTTRSGVIGVNSSVDPSNFGTTSALGAGVAGSSTNVAGVYGLGSGAGIPGVFGKGDPAADAYGVYGVGGLTKAGVVGVGNTYGTMGFSNDGYGVYGFTSDKSITQGGALAVGSGANSGLVALGGRFDGSGTSPLGGNGISVIGGAGMPGIWAKGGIATTSAFEGLGGAGLYGLGGDGDGIGVVGIGGNNSSFGGAGVVGVGAGGLTTSFSSIPPFNFGQYGVIGKGAPGHGGILAMGGFSSGGNGLDASANSGDGYGITASGFHGGHGVFGQGDQTTAGSTGIGVVGLGSAASPGVKGIGGNNDGYGGFFVGGNNSRGVIGFGQGTGAGVVGVGGNTNAPGIFGRGGNISSTGVIGIGTGTDGNLGFGDSVGVVGSGQIGGRFVSTSTSGGGSNGSMGLVVIGGGRISVNIAGDFLAVGDSTNVCQLACSSPSSPPRSPFHIDPTNQPTSGSVGDIYVNFSGVLRICTSAGTPGTWIDVGAQT